MRLIALLLLAPLLTACAERAVAPPECAAPGTCPVQVDDPLAGTSPTPLAFAAYDHELEPMRSVGCGAVIGLRDQPLDACHEGLLTDALGAPSLRLHLTSDSDTGTYTVVPGWSCEDPTPASADAVYVDAAGGRFAAVSGAVQIDTIGSGLRPIDGRYAIVVVSAGGQTLDLEGAFSAPPCRVP